MVRKENEFDKLKKKLDKFIDSDDSHSTNSEDTLQEHYKNRDEIVKPEQDIKESNSNTRDDEPDIYETDRKINSQE